MKNSNRFNKLFQNDKFNLVFSFFVAVLIWLAVVITVSPQTTRVIQNVKVTIDQNVPNQFGLKVFGNTEFTVDVTVTGKKYQISNANLSAEDIQVVALTGDVVKPGYYTLNLKGDYGTDNTSYKISSLSIKTIRVYFDTEIEKSFPIESDITVNGSSDIVEDGFSCGDINLSNSTVVISGPSAQVDKVEKVVAKLELASKLTENMSTEVPLVMYDESGNSEFEFLTSETDNIDVTIPVLKLKELPAKVEFKNAPDALSLNPLDYTVVPSKEDVYVLVSEYDTQTEYIVGSINFKELSPLSNVFTFNNESVGDGSKFTVTVDMKGYSHEYIRITSDKIKSTISSDSVRSVSDLNKSIVVVGKEEDLKNITENMITIDVDLDSVVAEKGKTKTVPVRVNVDSPNCWVYGEYTVDVSF